MSDELKKATPTDISALVRIRVEVEVTVGTWNSNESFNNLREKAIREGTNQLQNALRNTSVRIVGPVKSMHVGLVGEFK